MSNAQRYASLQALQDRLTDRTGAETSMMSALAGASTAVEQYCDRVFTLDAAASARTYTAEHGALVPVDDIGSVTNLAVSVSADGTTWTDTTANVWFEPANAIVKGAPLTQVRAQWYVFPVMARPSIKVTAIWGWPDVPDDVTEAVLIYASRLYSRRSSPTGVAGFGEFGVVRLSRTDADVIALIDGYRKRPL